MCTFTKLVYYMYIYHILHYVVIKRDSAVVGTLWLPGSHYQCVMAEPPASDNAPPSTPIFRHLTTDYYQLQYYIQTMLSNIGWFSVWGVAYYCFLNCLNNNQYDITLKLTKKCFDCLILTNYFNQPWKLNTQSNMKTNMRGSSSVHQCPNYSEL